MNKRVVLAVALAVCLVLTIIPIQVSAKQTTLWGMILEMIFPPQLEHETEHIKILNPVSNPSLRGEWVVEFETQGEGDLEIQAYEGTYFGKEIEFLGLYCGDEVMEAENYFSEKAAGGVWFEGTDNGKIVVKDWECDDERGKLVLLILATGKHHLRFSFLGENVYAENYADCTGTSVSPCYKCDVSEMNTTVYAPNDDISGPNAMSYSSTGGICQHMQGDTDFSTSDNWISSANVTFNVAKAGRTTVRIGGPAYQTIYSSRSFTTAQSIKVDYYTDSLQGAGSSVHVMAFQSSTDRFCVHYNSTNFRVQTRQNSGPYVFPFLFPISVSPNTWYTLEMVWHANGTAEAWVYQAGGTRNPSNYYSNSTYSPTWDYRVQSWNNVQYSYLSLFRNTNITQNETWTYSQGYTFCPAEGNYYADRCAEAEGDTNRRECIVSNEGFEYDYGWSGITRTTERANSGSYSGKIVKETAGETVVVHGDMDLHDNSNQYRFGGCFYSNGPSIEIYFFSWNATESKYDGTYDYVSSSTTGQWVCLQGVTTNVVSDDVFFDIRVDNNGGSPGAGSVWFDDIFVAKYLYNVNYDTIEDWCDCSEGATGCNGLSCWEGTNTMSWEGGTTQSCCGDDTEYYDYRNSYFGGSELWFDTDTSDDACCNADDDCVYGGTCYASDATYDLNSDGLKEAYCHTSGGELIKNPGAEMGTTYNWANFNGVSSADKNSGNYSFYREGVTTGSSSEYIAIDVNKEFNLEGWFKSYGSGGNSILYFGYIPYDEDKVRIEHSHVDIYVNSETTLYEACDSSDSVVKVTSGSSWVVYQYASMAFEVDDSGSYDDLPNSNLSNYNITRVEDMGSYWEVEFNTNVGVSAPSGTKVREHKSGGTYMYEAAGAASVPAAWTKYDATTAGENLYGTAAGKWWRGTKFARIMMLLNHGQSTDYKIRVDDLSLVSSQTNYTERWFNTDYSSSYCSNGGYTWNIGEGEATGDNYAGTWGNLTSSNYCYNRSTEEGGSFVASLHCCCGDDTGESPNVEETYSNPIAFDNDQQACCDAGTDCVGGTSCYTARPAGTTDCGLNVGGNDNCSHCYNSAGTGKWLECDQSDWMDFWCGNVCEPKKGVISPRDSGNPNASWNAVYAGEAGIGEYPDTSTLGCCGDDAGENYNYQNCDNTYACVTNTSDEACCDTTNDCIDAETCYTTNTHTHDANGNGDDDYCLSGIWYDCYDLEDCDPAGEYAYGEGSQVCYGSTDCIEESCTSNDCVYKRNNGYSDCDLETACVSGNCMQDTEYAGTADAGACDNSDGCICNTCGTWDVCIPTDGCPFDSDWDELISDCYNPADEGGNCYASSGDTNKDVDNDGDNDYCSSNTWYDCNTNAQCLNGGTQYECVDNDCDLNLINGGSGTTCDGANPCLYMDNSTGTSARFDDNGYVDVKGSYSYDQSSLSPPAGSFQITNSTGQVVLYIDDDGNLATRGRFTYTASPSASGNNDLIVQDSAGTVAGFIDGQTGNMYFKGDLHYNSNF